MSVVRDNYAEAAREQDHATSNVREMVETEGGTMRVRNVTFDGREIEPASGEFVSVARGVPEASPTDPYRAMLAAALDLLDDAMVWRPDREHAKHEATVDVVDNHVTMVLTIRARLVPR